MSDTPEIDPKDPNLAMAFMLTIAAMAIKIRRIDLHITRNPGMLDEDSRLKMAEALQRVERAVTALQTDLLIDRTPQEWGPCAKCGGTYRFETLAGYAGVSPRGAREDEREDGEAEGRRSANAGGS